MKRAFPMTWGAQLLDEGGVRFRLWAPAADEVALILLGGEERSVTMQPAAFGWYEIVDASASGGSRYLYEIDREIRVPDPAARFAPDGPGGASQVIDAASFAWPDRWPELRPFAEMVFYELHVGAFTPQGTYAAAAERFDYLVELGVTAIELMPLAETPGAWNWGYDGVMQYAPAHRYGTPDDLKSFVVAAHARGLTVLLDVVYNHFGPEGNYLHRYAPQYFTDRYATAWGAAIDYATDTNDAVRRYTIENAGYWLYEYGFDGLRLDAVHAIFDERATPILHELARESRAAAKRPVYLVLENDANDPALLRDDSLYDAQWNDDVHHALHVLLTGETDGYYEDFASPVALLGRALTSGFAYQGEPSPFRNGSARGGPSAGIPLVKFVNFLQNHDQIGNRACGERITALATAEAIRAAVALLLLAPSPPLLFMGEEWGADSPFLFFCDFSPELAKLVTAGRKREFEDFARSSARVLDAIPDPSAADTFERSKLDWDQRTRTEHREWLHFYRTLLRCRRDEIAPHVATVSGRDAQYRVVGERGLDASWRLGGDLRLHLDANLSAREETGFSAQAQGRVIFATHAQQFRGGVAPPWAVRWALASGSR